MKRYAKLHVSALLLLISIVMVVAISYAALTISTNPVVEHIKVSIGGSDTILVAPDVTYVAEDGTVYHFPGTFTDNMNFSDYAQYDYLKNVAGLMPVSTADGLTWYIPTYYDINDPEVKKGLAFDGQLRPTTDFIADSALQHANLNPVNEDQARQGHYIYLDFWVVAPVDGYKLRVSTGKNGNGTYVIDMLDVETVETEDGITYTLTGVNQQTAACVRLGFLVNEDGLIDNTMLHYSASEYFNTSYTRLKGVYNTPGMGALYGASNKFTIFEPNGDMHPSADGETVVDGSYVITEPLGQGGIPTSVSDRLSVQLANRWHMAGNDYLISQMFQTYLRSKNLSKETEASLKDGFYKDYLLYPYLTKGNFIANTGALYSAATYNVVTDLQLRGLTQAGATEDVYLTELTGGVPQRIRMFIWLEGQDVDCINSAATGGLAINIELAGSNES